MSKVNLGLTLELESTSAGNLEAEILPLNLVFELLDLIYYFALVVHN